MRNKTLASGMNRVPLLPRRTRQKYSPSSSPKSFVFHGPAASVNSRLTSQDDAGMNTPCPILRSSHSKGDRSHHSGVGSNLALWGRYMNSPHADERSVLLLLHWSTTSICLAILSGANRSSASNHWM